MCDAAEECPGLDNGDTATSHSEVSLVSVNKALYVSMYVHL